MARPHRSNSSRGVIDWEGHLNKVLATVLFIVAAWAWTIDDRVTANMNRVDQVRESDRGHYSTAVEQRNSIREDLSTWRSQGDARMDAIEKRLAHMRGHFEERGICTHWDNE